MAEISYEAVIGLEVHAQLKTKTKIFCGCSTTYGSVPNTQVCPVCLGHPGALPVLNKEVVHNAIKMGLATHSSIRELSTFSRKNYFYPDLPKGYQISQFEDPLCYDGYVELELENGETKNIGITRIHIEEDAGKSIHDVDIDTLVDLNRSGVGLIEIVSEPDIRTAREAWHYLQQIKQIVTYLDICDGNMEEGSLRCDANVSVRPVGQAEFGTKTEVKNMNSFRNVEKAIEFEINRQIELIRSGGEVQHETRMWDGNKQETRVMRTKEMAHDYRYFPEPDLPPLRCTSEWVKDIQARMPELGLDRKRRFVAEYKLPDYDADVLTQDKATADYYEEACKALQEQSDDRFKLVSNWIMTEVMRVLSEKKISVSDFAIPAQHIAEVVDLYASDSISSAGAKEAFADMLESREAPQMVVNRLGLLQVSDDSFIEDLVQSVLSDNEDAVQKYLDGKDKLFGFLVGQAMKASQGKGNPKKITALLREKLEALKA